MWHDIALMVFIVLYVGFASVTTMLRIADLIDMYE